MDFDYAIVGGGISGACIARALAIPGARVLVVEKTDRFADRVRGEAMLPWGVADARTLGVYEQLTGACAGVVPYWTTTLGDAPPRPRDLRSTTPSGEGVLSFFHPDMQETLLSAAEEAGAVVWRKARLSAFRPDSPAEIEVRTDGEARTVSASLVVGADGRNSELRRLAGMKVQQEKENPVIVAGLRIRGLRLDPTSVHNRVSGRFGELSLFVPTGGDAWRVYFVSIHPERARPLSGARSVQRFVESCLECGAEPDWFSDSRPDGPLASFPGADRWVESPAAEGLALVGDAAGAPDPSWGSGLSMSLRSVRLLRDALLDGGPTEDALRRYATQYSEAFGRLREVESFFHRALLAQGEAAEAFRLGALSRFAANTAPDMLGLGPDAPAEPS